MQTNKVQTYTQGDAKTFQIMEPPIARFLFADTRLASLWTMLRLSLGYEWLVAGWSKLIRPKAVDMKQAVRLRRGFLWTCFFIIVSALLAPIALGQAATEVASLYEDPDGLFTVPIPTNWQAHSKEGYVLLTDPESAINIYLLTTQGGDLAQAVADAWKKVNPAFDSPVKDTQTPPPTDGIEEIVVVDYETPQDRVAQGLGQRYGGVLYLVLIDGTLDAAAKRSSQINVIASGFKITALEHTNLADATPKPFDDVMKGELESFILGNMETMNIPGAVVAIVQGGEIVYQQAFGVKEQGKDDPMTFDTNMMIGSTGKSLTTMMMGTLVDDGKMTWDTPAQEILPSFAVKDPELSKTITMRNLVCACTGVPRRDVELIYNASHLTAQDIVQSLSSFEFFTDFGEAFQYSNQMVASGGYLAALTDGAKEDTLLTDYGTILRARVLDPIGMKDTTLSFDEVFERGNYAIPHGLNAAGEVVPLDVKLEQLLIPVAPAGAHWSTGPDMARYLMTELNKGVTPEGQKVISEENLMETWQPQVPVSDMTSYGLGWFVSEYKGLKIIQHGGNTFGFTSGFGFLPDKNLGVLVLTNRQASNGFNDGVATRVLELVFNQPGEIQRALDFGLEQEKKFYKESQEKQAKLEVDVVTAFLGTYTNEALGEITLSLEGDKMMLDTGEFKSELTAYFSIEKTSYNFFDPPMAGDSVGGFEFKMDGATPVIELQALPDVYRFMKQ